jgi:polysaccharide export outer membrane protein
MTRFHFVVAGLLGILLTGGAGPAWAQQGNVPGADTPPSTAGGVILSPAAGQPLDAPIRRSEYLLGPGDVVSLSLLGEQNLLYTLGVTPEGTVIVPGVGVVRVLGLNLDEAQARVRGAVLRFYRNVDVSLTLAQVGTFKVFLLGDVATPGVRLASSATRVSEIVAGARQSPVAPRNILLRRSTGDSTRVDLARFFLAGDLAANPTLQAGDVLVLPAVDETVEVYGRVFYPGTYEFRRGESLAELLAVANGGAEFPSNVADTIRVTRFVNPTQREFLTFSRAEAIGARGRALVLRPADAVFVAAVANFRRQRTATITGQVARPGVYPIRPDTTTVRDLVALAGGFTPDASLVSATLRRASGVRPDVQGLQNAPLESLSREEQEIQRIRAQGDETNVVIDFQQLFAQGQNAYDQTLRSGDVLTVPERRDEIAVLGAVRTPGLVQYVPGEGPDHYIARAGWYTRRADFRDAVVLRAKLGTPVQVGEVRTLEPGDVVVVPFKGRRTLVERLATTQTIASIASGLVFTIIGLSQILDGN